MTPEQALMNLRTAIFNESFGFRATSTQFNALDQSIRLLEQICVEKQCNQTLSALKQGAEKKEIDAACEAEKA